MAATAFAPRAARKAPHECNLFFFDCETGGLDHTHHELLEVACIVTDPSGQTVLDEWSTKVLPRFPERVDPGAAAVNGYDPEVWGREAVHIDDAMRELMRRADGCVFVAHSAEFDWRFLGAEMERRHLRWQGPWLRGDTMDMAFPLLREGLVPNLKLATLAEYFGVGQEQAHTALSDVRTCRELYISLMGLWQFALGTPALESAAEKW